MDKRLFLNVMIIALLTFYMIFNMVHRQLVDQHEPENQPDNVPVQSPWEQAVPVPHGWQLTRLEMASVVLQRDATGLWSIDKGSIDNGSVDNSQLGEVSATEIAKSWQQLQAISTAEYQTLPSKGMTILAFVAEDSQPLVFRVLTLNNELQIFRMIDKKQFNYPLSSKSRLIVE